ncbi:MAG: helicase, partial [Bacteroidetes bacterium]
MLSDIKDKKAEKALELTQSLLKEGHNTILFCRFIPTAKYVGEFFKKKLPKNTELLVITGEMVDEERKERINLLSESNNPKVLVATDCLSEGINLQEQFTAVIHYDLPWNPNRLEQREGRVDRFGQSAEEVKAYMLWGSDNPIDSAVLRVLLEKARQIKRQTGISVPFPDDSQSILDSLLNAVILNPNAVKEDQLSIDFGTPDISENELKVTNAYEKAARLNEATRSVFAQHSVKVNEIEQDLQNVDEAIGRPENVRDFVVESMNHLGAQIIKDKKGYTLYTTNLPSVFAKMFDGKDNVKISFDSPTPNN